MGAGSCPAGAAPAGFDLAVSSSSVQGHVPPVALQFDLTNRQWISNADGTLASIHWVDQKVLLALGFVLGSIPCSPTTGNTLRTIQRAAGPQLQKQVEDAVNLALADLVTSKQISVSNIYVFTPGSNQFIAQVVYVNLITQAQKEANIQ